MDWKQKLHQVKAGSAATPGGSAAAKGARAPLIEVFGSVQGEGRFAGLPMVFVRTATCPLRCLYCDTPGSYQAAERFAVRAGPSERFEGNPVTGARAAELVGLVLKASPHGRSPRVSLTGGEPLVFPDFVREFGVALRRDGVRLHLETAAIDPEALSRCVQQVDHLSADYKLPATLGAAVGGPATDRNGGYGELHRQCCEIALRRGATVDVKIVLTDAVTDPAFEQALEQLQPVRAKIQLILQPVTPFGTVTRRLRVSELERFLASAVRAGFDTRVLPQVHKILQLP
ncbi:MAG: 7-carboxy-7-deazaguanine synthase QueE [Planctomycetes bacterium]|nr:7-carboxy-7-deazaguanine synthase QueE [Planctomycetota bacterium]